MQIFFTEPSLVGFASKDQDLSSWPPSQITDSPVIWFQRRWGVRSYSEGCCGAKIFRIRWVEWSWPGRVPSGPSRTGPPSATLPPAHLALHTQQRRWLLRLQTGVRPCPRLDICKRPSLGRGRRVEGCQWWRQLECHMSDQIHWSLSGRWTPEGFSLVRSHPSSGTTLHCTSGSVRRR